MIMVILDNIYQVQFRTTSVYSIVIIFHWVISLSSAEYNLVNGETGKYRWFDTAAQIHRVCCYCPKEAVSSDRYNDAFQVGEDESRDSCNATQDEVEQTNKWPFCICDHKMGLKPEFIGCVLPNISRVEWTCDNAVASLNVSVYTTCTPRCTKDNMILVNPGAQSYRCGENKTWDNQPKSVSCRDKDKNEGDTENWKYMVIVIVPSSIIIAVILIVTCKKRLWHHCYLQVKREICSASSSEDSSSSRKEMLTISESSTLPDSSCGNTNDNRTSVTQSSDSGVQSDTCSISMDTIIETECDQERENVTKIDEDEEFTSSHDPLIDEENHPSVDRSKEDLIKEEKMPLLKSVYDTKPAQPLLVKVSGLRESYREDGIYYSVIRDKERPEPVGENAESLPYNTLVTDSMLTVEENLLEVYGPGSPSIPDEAICVQERKSPFSSINSSGANITSSDICDAMSQNKKNFVEECKRCDLTLTEALDQHGSSSSLSNICHMLDPTTPSESQCWIGFVKFYGLMEGFKIKSIEYHKKGNPEDGHMHHILHQFLPPLDFRVGHLVYYFSQKHSLRADVLDEIKKFHNNCKFCDMLRN